MDEVKQGSKEVRRVKLPEQAEGVEAVKVQEAQKKKFSGKVFNRYLFRLIFVLMTTIAVYSSYQLYIIKNPSYQEQVAKRQADKIITQVAKLIEIPTDTPQVATVADVDTLKKNQPFFEKAINGDKVLVFQDQAILYRESINKIINVAAVTRNSTPSVLGEGTTNDSETKTLDTKSTKKSN